MTQDIQWSEERGRIRRLFMLLPWSALVHYLNGALQQHYCIVTTCIAQDNLDSTSLHYHFRMQFSKTRGTANFLKQPIFEQWMNDFLWFIVPSKSVDWNILLIQTYHFQLRLNRCKPTRSLTGSIAVLASFWKTFWILSHEKMSSVLAIVSVDIKCGRLLEGHLCFDIACLKKKIEFICQNSKTICTAEFFPNLFMCEVLALILIGGPLVADTDISI